MKYQLTSQQIASKVAGEMVILNHDKGYYYGLTDVGVLIWEQMEKGPQTVEELVLHVCAEYEVHPSKCRGDISDLLNNLLAEKLVEIVEA
jgi:hypothetical protein